MAFFVRAGRLSIPLNSYIRPNSYGRSISTSKKNDETAAVAEKISSHKPTHGSQDVTAAAAAAVAARKVCLDSALNLLVFLLYPFLLN